MIDIHNHVLFGVDDGCKTIEESIKMIEKAVSVGVTELICTPHYAPLRGFVASNELINGNFDLLKEKVKELNLPIELYLGREIDEIDNIEKLLNSKEVQTLNDTKYVLVDFGMSKADIDEYCYELILNGYKPIIAHPERYNYVNDLSEYNKFRKTGALLQINASSLFHPKNKKTKKQVQYLLKNGLVDLVGSDCHRNDRNYEDFKNAIELISKKHKKNSLKQEIIL